MGVRKRPFEREDVVEHANVTYRNVISGTPAHHPAPIEMPLTRFKARHV